VNAPWRERSSGSLQKVRLKMKRGDPECHGTKWEIEGRKKRSDVSEVMDKEQKGGRRGKRKKGWRRGA